MIGNSTGRQLALWKVQSRHVTVDAHGKFRDRGGPFPDALTPSLRELLAHGQVRLDEQRGAEPPAIVPTADGEAFLAELNAEANASQPTESVPAPPVHEEIRRQRRERNRMHTSSYSTSSYTVVRQGCPFKFRVRSGDELEITVGDEDHPTGILFDYESFGAFLEQGVLAIQQMGHLHTHEQAEQD